MADPRSRRTLSNLLAARLVPHRFLAGQLRRPSGRFGRWVMTRGLDDGNAELIEETLSALHLRPDDDFLDLGFGGGRALRRAALQTRGALWGVDFSPDVVVAASRRLASLLGSGRLNVITGDVAALPLREGLVNAVCTTNTIYFWPDLRAGFEELRRVLAPGGRLALGYSGRHKMERFHDITRHGFRTFLPEDVEPVLRQVGFAEVSTQALSGAVTEGDYVTLAVR